MMDWNNGKPNSRYWILKLLKDNFNAGDKLVGTGFNGSDIIAQGFLTNNGRKLLLINPRNKEIKVNSADNFKNAIMNYVDEDTGENPIAQMQVKDTTISLKPFAVAVLNLKQ